MQNIWCIVFGMVESLRTLHPFRIFFLHNSPLQFLHLLWTNCSKAWNNRWLFLCDLFHDCNGPPLLFFNWNVKIPSSYCRYQIAWGREEPDGLTSRKYEHLIVLINLLPFHWDSWSCNRLHDFWSRTIWLHRLSFCIFFTILRLGRP